MGQPQVWAPVAIPLGLAGQSHPLARLPRTLPSPAETAFLSWPRPHPYRPPPEPVSHTRHLSKSQMSSKESSGSPGTSHMCTYAHIHLHTYTHVMHIHTDRPSKYTPAHTHISHTFVHRCSRHINSIDMHTHKLFYTHIHHFYTQTHPSSPFC